MLKVNRWNLLQQDRYKDFVKIITNDNDGWEGCSQTAKAKQFNKRIAKKYNITEEEWREVAHKCEKIFSIKCGMCS